MMHGKANIIFGQTIKKYKEGRNTERVLQNYDNHCIDIWVQKSVFKIQLTEGTL
jgi:hypothetical protein